MRQDFSSAAHFLIRLRILHPTIAILVSAYLIIIISWVFGKEKRRDNNKTLGRIIIVLLVLQLLAGFINVILLAPVWMQVVHLLLSDLVWISLVLFGAASLARVSAFSSGEIE